MRLSAAGAGPADREIPFPGHVFRVSGLLRDEPRQVVRDADFETTGEGTDAYALASAVASPEHELFPHCRRTGQ